jgi:hypothetical protein
VTDCNAQVVPGTAKVDLLLVVDDSLSMDPYQQALAQNLATFIDQLFSSAIAIDLHVGVTNTSVSSATSVGGVQTTYTSGPIVGGVQVIGKPYPAGSLVAVLDPAGAVTPGLLAYDPVVYGTVYGGWGGQRMLSTGGISVASLQALFKDNVRQGDFGSGKEQPLRAMKAAIDKAHRVGGENLGFLRDDARLAVVILTDEDDCSQSSGTMLTQNQENSASSPGCHNLAWKFATAPTDPEPKLDPLSMYVSSLDTDVGHAPIVAVVAGFDPATLDPARCTTNIPGVGSTQAFESPDRLDAFLGMLSSAHPGRTFKDSICSDFGPSLVKIAELMIPQTMPLQQAPDDYRMMVVSVQRGSNLVPCHWEHPGGAPADVVYAAAPPGGLASLTFQNACRLLPGDRVNIQILCAH